MKEKEGSHTHTHTHTKEPNERQVSNLSDIEFKVMVIRMLKELTDNYNELSGKHISMKKDRETLNKTN